jgi:hypothetical protein
MAFFNNVKTWWKGRDVSKATEQIAEHASTVGMKLIAYGIIAAVTPMKFVGAVIAKFLEMDVAPELLVSNGWVAVFLVSAGILFMAASFFLSLKPKKARTVAKSTGKSASVPKKGAKKPA